MNEKEIDKMIKDLFDLNDDYLQKAKNYLNEGFLEEGEASMHKAQGVLQAIRVITGKA